MNSTGAFLKIVMACSLLVPMAFSQENAEDSALSWKIPADIQTPETINTQTLQYAFDVFSWKSFIALNWPAKADGSADTNRTIGTDASAVWEHWMHTSDIFLPDGSAPKSWGSPVNTSDYCADPSFQSSGIKILGQTKKVSDFLILATEPMDTGPLIDQNGEYVQYEINLNKNMFDYVVDNELYYVEGQEAFAKKKQLIDFDSGNSKKDEVGAVMVKASWKLLGEGDDPSRFHTVDAIIWSNPSEKGDGSCRSAKVGLVGLHIAHKTQSAPQWVWSTFEQLDNAPDADAPECTENPHYSFYNCKEPSKKINKMAKQPWDPNRSGQTPTQVARVVPLTEETIALNRHYQNALRAENADTPWQYYMLVSTQWPTKPGDPTSFTNPDPQGAPAPIVLANTTLETFTQGTVPQIGTSCIDCHFKATNSTGQWTDFTYTLGMASRQSPKKEK